MNKLYFQERFLEIDDKYLFKYQFDYVLKAILTPFLIL